MFSDLNRNLLPGKCLIIELRRGVTRSEGGVQSQLHRSFNTENRLLIHGRSWCLLTATHEWFSWSFNLKYFDDGGMWGNRVNTTSAVGGGAGCRTPSWKHFKGALQHRMKSVKHHPWISANVWRRSSLWFCDIMRYHWLRPAWCNASYLDINELSKDKHELSVDTAASPVVSNINLLW